MKARLLAIITVLAVAAPSVAAAQPSATPVAPVADPSPPRVAQRKSPGLAFGLASLGVVGGLALFGLADRADDAGEEDDARALAYTGVAVAVIVPSAGHAYAGEWVKAGVTTAVRAGGFGLMVAGLAQIAAETSGKNGGLYLVSGSILYFGTTLYALIDAPFAAKRANRRNVVVAPTAMSSAGGMSPGVALVGSF
jgi:hypothetical protein